MDKQQKTLAIVKALAYTENGGKPSIPKAGKSGEMKSIFQFMPDTWKLYSKQVTGQELPLTTNNEIMVVHKKVSDWLEQGYNEEQIASMWNAGERNANAYKENHRGVNSKGVAYDTPAYAKKVKNYTSEFEKELSEMIKRRQPVSTSTNVPNQAVAQGEQQPPQPMANSTTPQSLTNSQAPTSEVPQQNKQGTLASSAQKKKSTQALAKLVSMVGKQKPPVKTGGLLPSLATKA